MKICLLNNLYKPYNRGGAENVTQAMIKSYQAKGHEVFLISTKPNKPDLGINTDCKTFYIKSDFYNLNKKLIATRLFWHINELLSVKKYNQIKNILKTEIPDLAISHNLMGLDFKTSRLFQELKIKHHHFLHDIQLLHPSGLIIFGKENIVNNLAAKVYQTLTKFFIGSPDLIISPSRWLLEEHKKRGFFKKSESEIKKLENILNINLKTDTQNDSEKIKNNKDVLKKLLFVGQIEAHKGILFLLDAFKLFAKPEMTLTVIGSGNMLTAAKKLNNQNSQITFKGRLEKIKLEEEMRKADALIMPSLCYENYPLVILEARQLGLPVIASDLGGAPEVIGPYDKLFKPGDAKDLFKKLNNY